MYTIEKDGKDYGYDFFTDEDGAHVIIYVDEKEITRADVSATELAERWGEGFDAENISEDEWDRLEYELLEKALKDVI